MEVGLFGGLTAELEAPLLREAAGLAKAVTGRVRALIKQGYCMTTVLESNSSSFHMLMMLHFT